MNTADAHRRSTAYRQASVRARAVIQVVIVAVSAAAAITLSVIAFLVQP